MGKYRREGRMDERERRWDGRKRERMRDGGMEGWNRVSRRH